MGISTIGISTEWQILRLSSDHHPYRVSVFTPKHTVSQQHLHARNLQQRQDELQTVAFKTSSPGFPRSLRICRWIFTMRRVAIISGAGSGIGRATALLLSKSTDLFKVKCISSGVVVLASASMARVIWARQAPMLRILAALASRPHQRLHDVCSSANFFVRHRHM